MSEPIAQTFHVISGEQLERLMAEMAQLKTRLDDFDAMLEARVRALSVDGSTWLTKKEVMQIMRVSERQVDRLSLVGALNPTYIGRTPRFNRFEVKAVMEQGAHVSVEVEQQKRAEKSEGARVGIILNRERKRTLAERAQTAEG